MDHQAVKILAGLQAFSGRCIVFDALRADLVPLQVYLLFEEAVLLGQLITTTQHRKQSPQQKHSSGYPWYSIDPDMEYKQITPRMSLSSYKTEQ